MGHPPPRDLDEVVSTAGWQFASSMPEIPHWYVVRGKATGGRPPIPVEWHDWLREQIQQRGYDGAWGRWTYRYLEHGGFKYWAIGPVINRERLTDAGDRPDQAGDGTGP